MRGHTAHHETLSPHSPSTKYHSVDVIISYYNVRIPHITSELSTDGSTLQVLF